MVLDLAYFSDRPNSSGCAVACLLKSLWFHSWELQTDGLLHLFLYLFLPPCLQVAVTVSLQQKRPSSVSPSQAAVRNILVPKFSHLGASPPRRRFFNPSMIRNAWPCSSQSGGIVLVTKGATTSAPVEQEISHTFEIRNFPQRKILVVTPPPPPCRDVEPRNLSMNGLETLARAYIHTLRPVC